MRRNNIRIAETVVAYGFSGIFLLAGLGALGTCVFDFARCHVVRKTWAKVPCEITAIEIKEEYVRYRDVGKEAPGGYTDYFVSAEYSYEYEGSQYAGDNYNFQQRVAAKQRNEERQLIANLLKPGNAVCYVNPNQPEESMLEPHVIRATYVLLAWGLSLLFVGVFMLAKWFRYVAKKKKELAEMPVKDVSKDFDVEAEVNWKPLWTGGRSFKSHKLKAVSDQRLESQATRKFLAIPLFTAVFPVHSLYVWIVSGCNFNLKSLTPILIFSIPLVIGLAVFHFLKTPRVFDLTKGYYWKGWKEPLGFQQPVGNNFCRLDEIYAIQVLAEHVRTKNKSYMSYELNLVLNDASRINVYDHADRNSITEDAQMLSGFLGVPMWERAR